MKPEFRRFLFFFLTGIFLIAGPLLTFWSLGYRFDFDKKIVTRVGAIFLKSDPPDVSIVIGPKTLTLSSSAFLYNGVLVKNLLPRSYTVEVSKAGFWSWKKNLEVKPTLVSKATHIWLLPRELKSSTILSATSVGSFWLDQKTGALFYSDGKGRTLRKITPSEGKSRADEVLLDLSISYPKEKIREVKPAPSGQNVLISLTSDDLIYRPQNAIPFLLIRPYFKTLLAKQVPPGTSAATIKEILWAPGRSDELLVKTEGALYAINTDAKRIYQVSKGPLAASGIAANNFYFITKDGAFYQFISATGQARLLRKLSTSTVSIIEGGELIAKINDSFLIYGKKRELLVLHPDDSLRYIDSNVEIFSVADDQTKAVFIAGKKLFFVSLKDELDDIQYKAFMPLQISEISDSDKILNIFWHKEKHHIILAKSDGVEIYEIDPRPPINRIKYELQNVRAARFDTDSSTFYYLADNEIKTMILQPQ